MAAERASRRPARKRMSILWSYPLTAAVAVLGVLLFALLYNGGGAASLATAQTQPASAQAQDKPLAIDVDDGTQTADGDDAEAPGTDGRLLPYLDGTLWGYKNVKGQTVIEPRFLRALEFLKESSAFAAVEQDGQLLYGLLARDGSWVTEPVWSDVRGFCEGLAAVERDDKWGYVDATGKAVIPCVYREASDFSCGRACVRPGSTFGYIDPDGDMAIAAQFDAAGDFGSDMAFVEQGGKRYIIDKVGEKIATLGSESGEGYSEGFAVIRTGEGSYVFYNTARKRAFSANYEDEGRFSDGYAAVKAGGVWGYIDTHGIMVISPRYAAAGEYAQDRAPVQDSSGKWGYIDKGGMEITPFMFDEAGTFNLGVAVVRNGDVVGIVDRSGTFTELYRTS